MMIKDRKRGWILYALGLLLSVYLLGCKESRQQVVYVSSGSSDTSQAPIVETRTVETVPLAPLPSVRDTVIKAYSDYNAVIIENTLLCQQPDSRSSATVSLMTGDQVQILEQGEKRLENGDRDPCGQFGYHWYKVVTTDNREGYVYGKQLLWKSNSRFILTPKEEKEVGYYSLTANNLIANDTSYYFDGAVDLGIGSSTTGCDRWYIPMLINSETNKVNFIYIDNSLLTNSDGHLKANREGVLMMLYESEGRKVEPYEIVNSQCDGASVITIRSSHHYQEGGSESLICISRRPDGWFDVMDVQRQSWDREPE